MMNASKNTMKRMIAQGRGTTKTRVNWSCHTRALAGARAASTLTVRKLTGALGAEVSGLDITQPVSDEDAKQLRGVLLEHLVVKIRSEETLSHAAHYHLSTLFGEPEPHAIVKGRKDFPEMLEWSREPGKVVDFGESWHTDNSFVEKPTSISLLYGDDVPPWGNDTLFANTYLAYEGLSEGMQKMLGGLNAVHSAAKAFNVDTKERQDRFKADATEADREYDAKAEILTQDMVHPVVRTHPETGKKILYVNSMFTTRFEGMTEEESAPLMTFLWAQLARPEYQLRLLWDPNQLTIWDNRSTQHMATNDNKIHRRQMRRVSLSGDRPM